MWKFCALVLLMPVLVAGSQCAVPAKDIMECGNRTKVDKERCLEKGCCWRPGRLNSTPLCFYPLPPAPVPKGSILLTYVDQEAGAEARLLETGWSAQGASVILTPEYMSPSGLYRLLSEATIAQAKAVVFLQTKSVVACGQCLLIAYWAALHQVPILPINIAGGGYDFTGGKKSLLNLDHNASDQATALLRTNSIDLVSAAWRLGTSLPYIISLAFDGTGSRGASSADPVNYIYNIIKNSMHSYGPGLIDVEAFKMWRHDVASKITPPSLLPYQPDPRHFNVYLSNYIKEGGRSAALLKALLLQRSDNGIGSIFLDVDDLRDLRQEATNVVQSKVLLVIATRNFFTRPYCLLETYWALRRGSHVAIVDVVGAGFERRQTQHFLDTLDHSLEAANPGSTATLLENGLNISEVQKVFLEKFENLAVLPFYDAADTKTLQAQVAAIERTINGNGMTIV